jgi:hypothetical protein
MMVAEVIYVKKIISSVFGKKYIQGGKNFAL